MEENITLGMFYQDYPHHFTNSTGYLKACERGDVDTMRVHSENPDDPVCGPHNANKYLFDLEVRKFNKKPYMNAYMRAAVFGHADCMIKAKNDGVNIHFVDENDQNSFYHSKNIECMKQAFEDGLDIFSTLAFEKFKAGQIQVFSNVYLKACFHLQCEIMDYAYDLGLDILVNDSSYLGIELIGHKNNVSDEEILKCKNLAISHLEKDLKKELEKENFSQERIEKLEEILSDEKDLMAENIKRKEKYKREKRDKRIAELENELAILKRERE